MKRYLWPLIIHSLFLIEIVLGGDVCTDQSDFLNNDQSSALELEVPDLFGGYLCSRVEVDWYTFVPEYFPVQVLINVTYEDESGDISLSIVQKKTTVASSSDGFGFEFIPFDLTDHVDETYIKITSKSPWKRPMKYLIHIMYTAPIPCEDYLEPNNIFEESIDLGLIAENTTSITGLICADDTDTFKFSPERDTHVWITWYSSKITTNSLGLYPNTTLTVYDSDRNFLVEKNSNSAERFFKWDVLYNNTYYITLQANDTAYIHMYKLSLHLHPLSCADVIANHTQVSFPSDVKGKLCEETEEDTYSVEVYAGAKFQVLFNSDDWQSYPIVSVSKFDGTDYILSALADTSDKPNVSPALIVGVQSENSTFEIAVQNQDQYFKNSMEYTISLLDVTCSNDADYPDTMSLFTAPTFDLGSNSKSLSRPAVMCVDEPFMYYSFNVTQGGDLTIVVNFTGGDKGDFDFRLSYYQSDIYYFPFLAQADSRQLQVVFTDPGIYYLGIFQVCCIPPAGLKFTLSFQWQPIVCTEDFTVPAKNEVVSLACKDKDYETKLFYGPPGSVYKFSCPSGCKSSNFSVVGSKIYSTYSSVCAAAIQAGVITNQGGQASLIRQDYRGVFVGALQNGINSSSSYSPAPAFSFEEYVPDHCVKKLFSYNNLQPVALEDFDKTSFVMDVTGLDNMHVMQVIVYVKIEHQMAIELSLSLTSPDDQYVAFAPVPTIKAGCNGFASGLDRWYSDSAYVMYYVSDSQLPYTAQGYTPTAAFSKLVGSDPNGAWQLDISDMMPNNISGSLISWSMQIYACSDTCSDGICTAPEVTTCPTDCQEKFLPQKMPDISSCRILDSEVYCWGDNTYGQTCQGNTLAGNDLGLLAPVPVLSFDKVTGGAKFVCAHTDTMIYCWGLLSNLHDEYDVVGDDTGEEPVSMFGFTGRTISKVASGHGHMCILYANGDLVCVGENTDGQCGVAASKPVKLTSDMSAIAIDSAYVPVEVTVGKRHTCVILEDRYTVKCWGHVAAGVGRSTALGASPSTNPSITFPFKLASLCAGSDFTCALATNGSVVCWGVTTEGRLGYNTTDPVLGDVISDFDNIQFVSDAEDRNIITQISCADTYACGLASLGYITCWGNYDFNNEQDPYHFAVNDLFDEAVGNVTEISSGQDHTCVMYKDNRMACWGSNTAYQLGAVKEDEVQANSVTCPVEMLPKESRTITSFEIGYTHACGIVEGNIKCWGHGSDGQLGNKSPQNIGDKVYSVGPNLRPVEVYPLGSWLKVVAGNAFTCALSTSGIVKCWGKDDSGQLALEGNVTWSNTLDPAQLQPIRLGFAPTDLCAGENFVCVQYEGQVACWGGNQYGQLGVGHTDNIGDDKGEMSDLEFVPVPPVIQLVCGSHHVCVVLDDLTVRCWGRANFGRLGYSENQPWKGYPNPLSEVDHIGDEPGEVEDLPAVMIDPATDSKVVQLGCGEDHCCAVLQNYKVKCWGGNHFGQLATMDTLPRFGKWMIESPYVTWAEDVRTLVVGRYHNCLLASQFICWGRGDSGELGFSLAADQSGFGSRVEDAEFTFAMMPPAYQITELFAGDSVTCVIAIHGNLVCWGESMIVDVFSGTPPSLSDVIPMGNCPAGFASEDSYTCSCCAPGTYRPSGDLNPRCSSCKAGSYSLYSRSKCTLCSPGSFQPAAGSPSCLPCDTGSFTNTSGATSCKDCDKGHYTMDLGSAICQECSEGYFAAGTGSTTCDPCIPGRFANKTGSSSCNDAAVGHYVAGYGLSGQELCEPGYYSPSTGAEACLPCSTVSFSNISGATECLPCPTQSSSKDTNGTACLCKDGMFMKNNECVDCPTGAVCTDGVIQRPKQGYWPSRIDYTRFYACPNPDVCFPNSTCAEGYEGPTCAQCSYGYSMADGYVCNKCPPRSENGVWIGLFVAAVIVVGIITIAKILKKLSNSLDSEAEEEELERAEDMGEQQANEIAESFGNQLEDVGTSWLPDFNAIDWQELKDLVDVSKVKVLVGFLQVFSQLDTTYDIPWPSSFVDFVSRMSFINFDFIDLTTSDCVMNTPRETFYTEFLIMIFAPLLLLGLLFLLLYLSVRFITRNKPPEASHVALYIDMYWHYSIFFVFLIYTGVSTKVLKVFRCTNIDGVDYLQADYTIECWTSKHIGMVVLGIVMVFVYPLGIPGIAALVLWRNKKAVVDDSTIRAIERQKLENAKQLEELQIKYSNMFTRLDQDNSGELDLTEFKQVCDQLGYQYRDRTVLTEAFHQASGGTSKISKAQFDVFLTSFLEKKIIPVKHAIPGAFRILNEQDEVDDLKVALAEERKRVQTRYGMLYNDYEPSSFMWEVWDMFRKLLLAGGMIFVARGTTIQIGIALLICIFSLVLHTHFKAYVENTTDMFQFGTLCVLTLTLFSGLLLKAQEGDTNSPAYENNVLSGFLIFINATILVLALTLMAWKFYESAKKFYAKYQETVAKIQKFIDEKTGNNQEPQNPAKKNETGENELEMSSFPQQPPEGQGQLLLQEPKAAAAARPTRQAPSLPGSMNETDEE